MKWSKEGPRFPSFPCDLRSHRKEEPWWRVSLFGQIWEFFAFCFFPVCELLPAIKGKDPPSAVIWGVQAISSWSSHLRPTCYTRTQAPLGWNRYKQLPCFHLAVSTDHPNGGRAGLGKSLGTPVGSSTRLQTNLTENRRAAGAVRGPLFPEFPASSRFLPILTCLQASQLWQFNWCGEGEAVGSRQGWPVFWKKKTPLGWGHGTVTGRPEKAVYWQVRQSGSWFSRLFLFGLVGPGLCVPIGSQCLSPLKG